MNRPVTPAGIAPPHRNIYSHGIEVPAGARTLFVSGQLGLDPSGKLGADFRAEADRAMGNVLAVLAEAGMGPQDLVKLNAYLTRPADLPVFAEVRAAHLEGAKPAMTTVFVSGLAAPDWSIEVEAVAAKA